MLGVGSFLFLQPPPPNQEIQNTAIHGGQMDLYARQYNTSKKLRPPKKQSSSHAHQGPSVNRYRNQSGGSEKLPSPTRPMTESFAQ